MEAHRYEIIKLLLSAAKEYYLNEKIKPELYLKLIESIERDFLAIQQQKQKENIKSILDEYIANLS